jgi:RHS repeat-associated protein
VNSIVRETLNIMDDKQRITLVETSMQGDDVSSMQLIRYQFGNHLSSANLELDDQAQIISYEEYTPYGSTSYQAVSSGVAVSAKRYRYTGRERDEETGFTYHGARYCASWLGRWTAADPIGIKDGSNLYRYCVNNPIMFRDLDGKETIPGESTGKETPEEIRNYAKEAGFGFKRFPTIWSKENGWDFGNNNLYELTTRFDPGPPESIPSGPYSTDPHSGKHYDPLAPKNSQKSIKTASGRGSTSGASKSISGISSGGNAGGTVSGTDATRQPISGNTPSTRGDSGSGNQDGWLPSWVADAIEIALVAVVAVAAITTFAVFATAFSSALAVEGTTIGTAATLAAGEVITGVGATSAAAGTVAGRRKITVGLGLDEDLGNLNGVITYEENGWARVGLTGPYDASGPRFFKAYEEAVAKADAIHFELSSFRAIGRAGEVEGITERELRHIFEFEYGSLLGKTTFFIGGQSFRWNGSTWVDSP